MYVYYMEVKKDGTVSITYPYLKKSFKYNNEQLYKALG